MSGSRMKKDRIMYVQKFGFTLCQQNGQRTYGGPPPNWGSRVPPSRDTEVFIGRLPRMCFEDELIPLFLTAGELYEFRLMLDFSGTNRGYGYAHYATQEGATKAIKTLNKFEIRPGHQIGVLKSKNNCRLLFGNIGSALNTETFNEFIRSATDQVLHVLMFKSFQQLKATDFSISSEVEEAFLARMARSSENNQFAVVEYENHKAAAVARRVLIPKYGHILAVDWAVPPHERKRFVCGNLVQISAVERPLQCTNPAIQDPHLFSPTKATSKTRPVPVLLTQPSALDNVPFMPKNFHNVVKYFKYQLSACLYKSISELEIPVFICKEVERKIVDRITNLENCGQAVRLIFNYFSWYNENKRFAIDSDFQKRLQEVKVYADSFVRFVNRRLKYGPSQNPSEDNYYMNTLPLQLNILFRIILRTNGEYQAKLSAGITKGLNWLVEVMRNGDNTSKQFIEDIINLMSKEDSVALDKASHIAKTVFLNSIIAESLTHITNDSLVDSNLRINSHPKNIKSVNNFRANELSVTNENVIQPNDEKRNIYPNKVAFDPQKISMDASQRSLTVGLKVDVVDHVPLMFSRYGNCKGVSNTNLDSGPSVPLLLVQPSILNNVPFMPKIFNDVLTFFKHLVRVCVYTILWQLNLPQKISIEIERKIIDRISNMENCGEGIELILNYLTRLIEKKRGSVNSGVLKLLHEVKQYADSFVQFIWNKTLSGYQPNPSLEHYFCEALPLRLNLLFRVTMIFNSENPMRFLTGISEGLNWLDEVIEKGDKKTKEFIEELTRFILELDPFSYEKAKNLGKMIYAEMFNSEEQTLRHSEVFPQFITELKNMDKINYPSLPSNSENGLTLGEAIIPTSSE